MVISYTDERNERHETAAGFRSVNNGSFFGRFFLELSDTGRLWTQQDVIDHRVRIEQAKFWELRAYQLWHHEAEKEKHEPPQMGP